MNAVRTVLCSALVLSWMICLDVSNNLDIDPATKTVSNATIFLGGFVIVMWLIMAIFREPRLTKCPRCQKRTPNILIRDGNIGDIYCQRCGGPKHTVTLFRFHRHLSAPKPTNQASDLIDIIQA